MFKRWNTLVGWSVFAVATAVYLMTMEPVSSLWDCSEFIATSYKLEVGHPPGAPLFMMLARIATMFSFGNPDLVGPCVNAMNSIASGFCILFLFWTITHLGRRMATRGDRTMDNADTWCVIGAGVVGALAYTFTDTFWFSAIEGEVYALSSMFTALVVWLMLKWEEQADEPHSSRWIILIAYLMGLSIGVHILNLLSIPALVFIYYFRKSGRVTMKGMAISTLIAGALVVFINYIIIPFTIWIGAQVDTFTVNVIGLPVNFGFAVWALALVGGMGYATWWAYRRNKVLLNTCLLAVTMILVGFSSYASVVIRAVANPPLNSNNPNNPHALLSVLNREQYGNRPLIYGAQYSAPIEGVTDKTVRYIGDDGRYATAQVLTGYVYPSEFMHLFPRMWSPYKDAEEYRQWSAYRTKTDVLRDENGEVLRDENGRAIRGEVLDFGRKRTYYHPDDIDENGNPYYDAEPLTVVEPTFLENLNFFFNYQLSYMYWRYFLWNFVGRQSDIQPTVVTLTDGNWLSGIRFLDEMALGPQENLPREIAGNKARNTYYFLPFILGLIGLIYQLNRDRRNFSIVMWLFLMTGVVLVLYFNTAPGEPRERDYVYAGSFYAFSIWIGLGVMALRDMMARLAKRNNTAVAAAATVVALSVPAILAAENWDDHDRSHRYMARDIGWNYLMSTLPNSIILNYGDNDTFPLWNNQEVYGVRPDVRIMNTSYLGGEWYIDQMKHRAYEAEGVPFSLPRSKYTCTNDQLLIDERVDRPVDAKEVIGFVASEDKRTKIRLDNGTPEGELADYIPARRIAIPVDKANAVASGIVKEKDYDKMVDTVYINLKGRSIDKSQLMLIDMLANFEWKRPIFMTQIYMLRDLGLTDYLQFDGYAYRLVPIRTPYSRENCFEIGRVDPDYAAPLLRDTFRYGNLADERVYADYFTQYNLEASHARDGFARVAKALLVEGRGEEAVELLDLALQRLPTSQIRFTEDNTLPLMEAYYAADALGVEGAAEKGDALMREYVRNIEEYIDYYLMFDEATAPLVQSLLYQRDDELFRAYYLAAVSRRNDIVEEINDYYRTLGYTEEELFHLDDAGSIIEEQPAAVGS